MALFLIKFNLAAMALIFPLALLWHAVRDGGRRELLTTLLVGIAGAVALALPFVVILSCQGCLDDFWNEYITRTLTTASTNHSSRGLLATMIAAARGLKLLPLIVHGLIGISCVMLLCKLKRYRLFPLLAFLSFWSISMLLMRQAHHHLAFAFALLFVVIVVLDLLKPQLRSRRALKSLLAIAVTLAVVLAWGQNFVSFHPHHNFYTMENDSKREYHFIASLLNTRDKPRVLYWWAADVGLGTQAEALPACRYWATQYGATVDMREDQSHCIMRRDPDFVIVHARTEHNLTNMLKRYGYSRHVAPVPAPYYVVYSKE